MATHRIYEQIILFDIVKHISQNYHMLMKRGLSNQPWCLDEFRQRTEPRALFNYSTLDFLLLFKHE